MLRFSFLALACACGLTWAMPASAADVKPAEPKDAKKEDPVEVILRALAGEVQPPPGNVNDIPFFELLVDLSKKHNLTIIINEESFRAIGEMNFKEDRPHIAATQFHGLTVRQFLAVVLNSKGGAYLVRNNFIEIVPASYAAEVTKAEVRKPAGEEGRPQLKEPLVSAIIKDQPLDEAVAKIAEMYGLNVVVSPQAGQVRPIPVTARLLNVPAEQAIELLALQADLRVVRKANALLVTSKEQAKELFTEKLQKERQLIELQKLREVKPEAPLKTKETLPSIEGKLPPGARP